MMNNMNIAQELVNRGFDAKAVTVNKNGKEFEAVTIKTESNIAPTIYTEALVYEAAKRGFSDEWVVDEVIRQYEAHKDVSFDCEIFSDKNFIARNITIGLQKKQEDNLIKKESGLDGIEKYLYLNVKVGGENGTIKITDRLLAVIDVDADTLWFWAEGNLRSTTVIEDISEMFGIPGMGTMFVVSNDSKVNGAANALDTDTIKTFAMEQGFTEYCLIPSSRHEMILLPIHEGVMFDIDTLSQMVVDVNLTTVDAVDQLGDKAYHLVA